MPHGHALAPAVSHFGDETSACLEADLYTDFGDFVADFDRCCRLVNAAQLGWIVALLVHLLAVERTMQSERLSAWATTTQGGGKDLDSFGGESLDVQNIQAFPEPVDEEVADVDSVARTIRVSRSSIEAGSTAIARTPRAVSVRASSRVGAVAKTPLPPG